ncbi:MAG: hypothetical protein JEZ05_04790 [Tenericutes bacterium]|nr:hypothetical protein [Mycoplasmatota bacterium]
MKNGLNQDFYKWIDDVRKAIRKKDELEKKIKYYERRLNSCKGVTYDVLGGRGNSRSNEDNQIYWIDRISKTKKAISYLNKPINYYECFKIQVGSQEKLLLQGYVIKCKSIRQIAEELNVSSSMIMKIMNNLSKKYSKENITN